MHSALHLQTKVSADHKIEIQDPNLPTGETVDVFVIATNDTKKETISVLDFIDQLPGQRQFKTAAEVDRYLKEQRNSWDS